MSEEVYKNDIFYDIRKLDLDKIKELLKEAYKLRHFWSVDILKRIQRESIKMSFEEIMEKCVKENFFVFVFRRGYSNWNWYLEIGFRTMSIPDYFLFIDVDKKHLDYFVDKYGLKTL